MSDVVVVGAGVGGLAVALRLAAAGHRVNVYECADSVGGKLGRHVRRTRAGEFRFDTGPTLLTMPQIVTDLFRDTGGDLTRYLELVEVDPIVRHCFADGTVLDSCSDQQVFAERIAGTLGELPAKEWRHLWRRAERAWNASWRHVFNAPARSTLALSKLAWRLGDLSAVGPGRTLRGLWREYLSDPRLRMLLDRYATYAGADPRRAPAALLAVAYAELRFGGWYLRGGLATLADALAARCREVGVQVHTGSRVVEIETAGRRVHGVRVAGGRAVPADVVVANVDALEVYLDLLPDKRRARRLRERGMGGFRLLVGANGRTPALAHHTVLFPADYDAEFDDIFGRPRRGVVARPARDPAVFISVADDPAVRPEGHEAWSVLVNAPSHGDTAAGVNWMVPELPERYANRILHVLAERGVEVRDRVLFREVMTPADLQARTGSPGGAIHGTPVHGFTGVRRPPNRGGVRGLFLVGGSVHPGGGLSMAMLSAKIVAAQIGPA